MSSIITQISGQNVSILLLKAQTQLSKSSAVNSITITNVLYYIVVTAVSLLISIATYRLYFHHLSKYPGPRLWAISRLPYAYHLATGDLPHRILQIHEKYGAIARLAPKELSFITEEAWADIYGKQLGRPQLQKDQFQMYLAPDMAKSLLTEPDDAMHGRMRRNFSHAFSEKTLRESEPILQKYFDKLILKLRENAGKPVNMADWYDFTLFDTIGDLLFGRSFDCLDNSAAHFWVALISSWTKGATYLGTVERFWPPLLTVALKLLPKSLGEAEILHRKTTADMLNARMEITDPRPDFLSQVLETSRTETGETSMTYSQIIESTKVLMAGGSETSSSALSAVTYYLLLTPSAMAKLTSEIRTTYKSESEITMASVQNLKWILPCIYEAIRMFPPLPGSMRRIVSPAGRMIGGHFIREGTLVAVDEFSAGRYSGNFARALEFCPERYLGDGDPEFINDKQKAFRPFSMGPRDCLGKALALAEMRIILARILFNFDLELVGHEKRDWVETMPAFTFWEKTPLMVKLTPVF